MKQAIRLISIILLFAGTFASCDLFNDTQSAATSRLTFKVATSNKTNLNDTILFTSNNIKSFNELTGEVVFTDTLIPKKLGSYHLIKCLLGTDSLFAATLTSDIMSSIVNDLVLNHNLEDGKFYFEDGYPNWIDNFGATNLRAQNKKNRAVAWNRFINQLKLERKLKE